MVKSTLMDSEDIRTAVYELLYHRVKWQSMLTPTLHTSDLVRTAKFSLSRCFTWTEAKCAVV